MSIKKLLPLCVCCTLLCFHSLAQDKWDLRRCVDYAVRNNISIRQADIDARVAKLTYEQTKASRYGQFSFNTSLGLNFGRAIDPTTNQFSTSQTLYQGIALQGGANLFNWFSIRRAIESNRYYYEAQAVNIDKAKNDVTLNVAAAYLTALLAREQVLLAQTKLDLTRQQLENTRKLVAAGSLPELNAAELEAQFATDTSSLIAAQQTYDIDVLGLKAFLSMDAAMPFELDTPPVETIPVEPISEMQPEIVYAMAEKTFPQQRMNDLRITAAQKNVQSIKVQLYQTIAAFGSLADNFANDLKTTEPHLISPLGINTGLVALDGTNQLPVYEPSYYTTTSGKSFGELFKGYGTQMNNNFYQQVGIQINVPIFNGNLVRTNYEKAKLNVKTANLQKESDLLTLKQNVYQAYFNAVASLEKFEANKKAVATAERSFDLATKRYNIGMLNTIDYLVNQNNLFTARINQLAAQYDYVFRMKVLEYYKGLGVKL